jgi:hypothetical protein
MASWIVVACLLKLRDEFNALAPARAKGADGTIGDTAHAAGGTSDHLPDEDYPALHNKDADHVDEVHALDITTDLNVPGLTLETVVQFILGRCRSGAEKRLRYIIFNRRIWESDTKTPWSQQVYTGTADPHTGHAHFSASYDSKLEASTASWHLEDIPVALTKPTRTGRLLARIGRRGAALLFFALLDLVYAVALLTAPRPLTPFYAWMDQIMPLAWWAACWGRSG